MVQERERRLLVLVGVLASIWLAIQIVGELWRAFAVIADVALIFIVAWALAYLLGPLVERIDRRTRLSRAGAVGVLYLGIAILLTTILAIVIPGMAAATLAPLGVPFAEVLAVIAGLAVVIPFFGPIIAMIPIAVIALLGSPDRFILVMVITLVVQQVMFNVVSPRILSDSVGLHPLAVLAALLIGVRVAGFWGVFLALPVTGIGAIFVRYAHELSRGRLVRTEAAELITPEEPA